LRCDKDYEEIYAYMKLKVKLRKDLFAKVELMKKQKTERTPGIL